MPGGRAFVQFDAGSSLPEPTYARTDPIGSPGAINICRPEYPGAPLWETCHPQALARCDGSFSGLCPLPEPRLPTARCARPLLRMCARWPCLSDIVVFIQHCDEGRSTRYWVGRPMPLTVTVPSVSSRIVSGFK